eukprot:gb/GFBE01019584.1/.p1 GENE.gb/GFBE01019584.1/~~gb/GFBE01019584.1/.p1  ORF type:complete len:226 (+),score=43.21 gb/GFBE01019584.1/:1-678(+)
MAPVTERRRRQILLLGSAAIWLCLSSFGSSRQGTTFVESTAVAAKPQEGPQVSRADALRLLPALAVGGFAAPSRGASGVTAPWGKRPDGGDDEIHTGGVEWEDIKVGTGASPAIGDQIAINYQVKAIVREREIIIDDTKGTARDFRFGTGQMIPGMDEGVAGMRTGGTRKMRIPGNLAFGSKAIPAAVGRPSVPQYTPVEATVTLEFIPGTDAVYDYATSDRSED